MYKSQKILNKSLLYSLSAAETTDGKKQMTVVTSTPKKSTHIPTGSPAVSILKR